ncbi:hypothetical protein ACS0TY_013666 [Phlomoides rotata]
MFCCYLSFQEPKNIGEAMLDSNWIVAMQEELNQFEMQQVWELVDRYVNQRVISTK